MKIIVCVKQVPATNEVQMDPVTNTIIREGVDSILNPFDTYAVEEALRVREKRGAELVSLSMGIPSVTEILKGTIALGMDRSYLLTDRAFAGADTLATAHALAAGIRKIGGADIVLCGKMAMDGDTAQVGPMLGEMLDLPHVTDVSRIEEIGGDYLLCRKLTDDGYLNVRVRLPAVITVVKEINVPRLPSISGMLRGRSWDVPRWGAADVGADPASIGLSGSPTQVVKTFVPVNDLKCQWFEGSAAEKAKCLIGVLEERRLVTANSVTAASSSAGPVSAESGSVNKEKK